MKEEQHGQIPQSMYSWDDDQMRKGQHLALESVATFGLTLIAAVGVVQMFGTVNDQIVNSAEDTQAQIVSDRIRSAIIQMSYSSQNERGYQQVNLPDQIGGKEYQVALEQNQIIVFTDNNNYEQSFNTMPPSTNMRGSVEGGTVRLFQNSEGLVLREGR